MENKKDKIDTIMDKSKDKSKDIYKDIPKKSSTKLRCHQCNKKLKMIHFTCRCNHTFCVVHQNPHSHNCSFNNKKICQDSIKKQNPQTIHQKFVKI